MFFSFFLFCFFLTPCVRFCLLYFSVPPLLPPLPLLPPPAPQHFTQALYPSTLHKHLTTALYTSTRPALG